jgi:hypothetical protein
MKDTITRTNGVEPGCPYEGPNYDLLVPAIATYKN